MWKNIDGYFWPYRIDDEANVEWLNPKNGKWIRLKPFMVRTKQGGSYGHLCVRLKTEAGIFKNVYVKSLMVDAFFGGKKKGYVFIFKNESLMDCSLNNLKAIKTDEFYRKIGGSLRKSIEKIDERGNVLDLYSSVTEAAEANFMSRRAVTDRCRKKVKHPFALTGFSFRYEKPRGICREIDFIHRED